MINQLSAAPVCFVCGTAAAEHSFDSEPNLPRRSAPPDLDLRPAEADLRELSEWVAACEECGYCHTLLGESVEPELSGTVLRQVVEATNYQAALHDARFPALANRFRCLAQLQQLAGAAEKRDLACMSLLYAAWVCDDCAALGAAATGLHASLAATQARQLRREAAQLLRDALEAGRSPTGDAASGWLVLADLYRRAEAFPSAHTSTINGLAVAAPDTPLAELLRLEQHLAAEVETGAVSMAQAFG